MSLSPAKEARIASAFDKLGEPEKQLLRDTLCKVDAVAFARIKLGVMPDEWQKQLMRSTSDLAALCGSWPRRVRAGPPPRRRGEPHGVVHQPDAKAERRAVQAGQAAIVKAIPDAVPNHNRLQSSYPRLAPAQSAGRPGHGARAHGIARALG